MRARTWRVASSAGVNVRFALEDAKKAGYPQTLYMDLDTAALRRLGWKPQFPFSGSGGGIEKMVSRMASF